MLDRHFPAIYQRIQIQSERDGRKERYYTRIEDFDEHTLTVGMPLEKGARKALRGGARVDAIAIAEDCLYLFPSTVQQVKKMGQFPVLVLDRPAAPKKLQRRNFFRMPAALPVKFRLLDAMREVSSEPFREALTKDIGGGGVLFVVDKSVRLKHYVEMEISFSDFTVSITGRVARSMPSTDGADKVEVGVEFMRISRTDQEKIIRFVYERKRAQADEHREDGVLG